MKRLIAILIVFCLLFSCMFSLPGFAAIRHNSIDTFIHELEQSNENLEQSGDAQSTYARRIIVKALQAPAIYAAPTNTFSYDNIFVYQYDNATTAYEALEYYKTLPYVEWAEQDGIAYSQQQSRYYAEKMLGTSEVLTRINASDDSLSPVKVAVVDTGIDFNFFANYTRVINSGCNTSETGTADSAEDDQGHGSMVSEIILRNTPASVDITGYKALDKKGHGSDLAIATSIKKAADDGADVINLSLGGIKNDTMLDAVDYAYEKGCIVVCAAGNDSTDVSGVAPACSENVITVTSIDDSGHKSYFSNFGETVDFAAPGSDIYFSYTNQTADGTSFSSPYITAEVALLLSLCPSLSLEEVIEQLRMVSVHSDALKYQSGFIASTQDQGIINSTSSLPTELMVCEKSKDDYFGNGMPMIDVLYNRAAQQPDTATPEFITAPGEYTDETVYLAFKAEANTQIYYTTDERYPTAADTLYTEPIALEKPTSVRAVAYSSSGRSTPISGCFIPYQTAREEDFTLSQDGKTITAYTGTDNNIIVPQTIQGYTPETFDFLTPNTTLCGITLPNTIKRCSIETTAPDANPVTSLSIFKAPALEEIETQSDSFFSLSIVELPRIQRFCCNSNKFLKAISLPQATEVKFTNCRNLEYVDIPRCKNIGEESFNNCMSLRSIHAPQAETLGAYAFKNCYKLNQVTIPNVCNDDSVSTVQAFQKTYCLKELTIPHLRSIGKDFFKGSGIRSVYAPALESAQSLPDNEVMYTDDTPMPEKEHARMILSDAFKECTVSANRTKRAPISLIIQYYHNLVDVYGTNGTFAQRYAKENQLDFYSLPLILSQPENMGCGAFEPLQVEVLGYHLSYQWYGTNIRSNLLGVALTGEIEETLDTNSYPYTYYYCRITAHDGTIYTDTYTGDTNLVLFDCNEDNTINLADISVLLCYWAQESGESNRHCDFNQDGIIDILDLSVLLNERVYALNM